MIGTVHLLAGALIGAIVPSRTAVVVISFFSHYLLDILPHIDPATFADSQKQVTRRQIIAAVVDAVLLLGLGVFFFYTHERWVSIILGGIAAQIPDWFIPLEKYKLFTPFRRMHELFHWDPHRAMSWSWYTWGLVIPTAIAFTSFVVLLMGDE